MHKLILTTTLFICLSCNTNETTVQPTENNPVSIQELKYRKALIIEESDYSIKIEVINQKTEHPSLLMSMTLKDGAYYASPLTEENLTGKFYYDFGEYVNLEFFNTVIETPLSTNRTNKTTSNITDPYWAIKTNTTYEQELTLKTDKDFEVMGRVQFTIEPRCTFEIIPFGIKYENGEYKMFSPKC